MKITIFLTSFLSYRLYNATKLRTQPEILKELTAKKDSYFGNPLERIDLFMKSNKYLVEDVDDKQFLNLNGG